jgi:hypothetical protein
MDADARTRAAIEEHWRASVGGDIEAEHAAYASDAILDYPQSGERFRSREAIAAQRGGRPADRHFNVLRIIVGGDVWVSECVITYDAVLGQDHRQGLRRETSQEAPSWPLRPRRPFPFSSRPRNGWPRSPTRIRGSTRCP